jgi:hypothetical protein
MSGPMQTGGWTISGLVRVAPDGFRANVGLRKCVERGFDVVATIQRDSILSSVRSSWTSWQESRLNAASVRSSSMS